MNVKSIKKTVLVMAILLFVSITVIRLNLGNPILTGDESYHTLRMAEIIQEKTIINYDSLSDSEYKFSIFHYVIAFIPATAVNFLPLLLGLLTGFLFFKTLNKKAAIISTTILFVSPLFLNNFSSLSIGMFSALLFVLSKYALHKSKIILFTFLNVVLALTYFPVWLLASAYFYTKKTPIFSFLPGLAVTPFVFAVFVKESNLLFEFGSAFGYGLAVLVISIIGLIMNWNKKNSFSAVVMLLGFLTSYFLPELRLIIVIMLLPYAGLLINTLTTRDWKTKDLAGITNFLIILVIAFSGLNQATALYKAQPSLPEIDSYSTIERLNEGRVIATQENGALIQFYGKSYAFADLRSGEERKVLNNKILRSQNIVYIEEQLQKHNLKYVKVHPNEERSGILFIIDNSNLFKQRYRGITSEIWEYIPEQLS